LETGETVAIKKVLQDKRYKNHGIVISYFIAKKFRNNINVW
jgi:hypothetical protein